MSRFALLSGSFFGGTAVALGAFGAHWLRSQLPKWELTLVDQARQLEVWETAVRYQMFHALALLAIGLLAERISTPKLLTAATWLFVIGTVIFSGLLYSLVLTGVKVLGAIVPIGGTALIAGWLLLAIAILRSTNRTPG